MSTDSSPSHSISDGPPAEAEIKIRLTEASYHALPAALLRLGFVTAGEETLTDFYLDYHLSPQGGYDFRRIRQSGASYLLTEKRWIRDANGNPVRLEEERALTAADFSALCAQAPEMLTLKKTRKIFTGIVDHLPVTVVLDHLKLADIDHYFIEGEAMTPPAQAHATRERIRRWLHEALGLAVDTEAPSMLELLLEATSHSE